MKPLPDAATQASLQQLRDIHLPPPVSWWPPAVGWWLLALLILLALALFWWRRGRPEFRARQWRRAALAQLHREIDAAQQRYRNDRNAAALCAALSTLMRRVARTAFPEESVAGLHGAAWLDFLDRQQLIATRFSGSELGDMLCRAPFAASVSADPTPLVAACRDWMEAAIRRAPAP